jgi:hypothetical protein
LGPAIAQQTLTEGSKMKAQLTTIISSIFVVSTLFAQSLPLGLSAKRPMVAPAQAARASVPQGPLRNNQIDNKPAQKAQIKFLDVKDPQSKLPQPSGAIKLNGGADPSGGVGFVCQEAGDKTKIYLADTYSLAKTGVFDILKPTSPSEFIASIVAMLNGVYPEKVYQHPTLPDQKVSIGWLITYTYGQLKFKLADSQNLPQLEDDHIDPASVPRNCEKIQLAVQDVPSKVVRVSPRVSDLNWGERGLLEFHETLISLRNQPGADTTEIRHAVDKIAVLMRDKKYFVNTLKHHGDDCYISIDRLRYTRDGIFGIFLWGSSGPFIHETMQATSTPNQFVFSNAETGANIKVTLSEKKAYFEVDSPRGSQHTATAVKIDEGNVSSFYSTINETNVPTTEVGYSYRAYCTFGLHDLVDALKKEDTRQMDILGPQPDWEDTSATSIEWLPEGTVLELTEDLEVIPGTDTARTTFIEQNGLHTHFPKISYRFRFASAEFFNANNSYNNGTVQYPKGMRILVTKVERAENPGGYYLRFKTVSDPKLPTIQDPITWMQLDGRRAHDIKIPQFAELVKSKFKVILPKK